MAIKAATRIGRIDGRAARQQRMGLRAAAITTEHVQHRILAENIGGGIAGNRAARLSFNKVIPFADDGTGTIHAWTTGRQHIVGHDAVAQDGRSAHQANSRPTASNTRCASGILGNRHIV